MAKEELIHLYPGDQRQDAILFEGTVEETATNQLKVTSRGWVAVVQYIAGANMAWMKNTFQLVHGSLVFTGCKVVNFDAPAHRIDVSYAGKDR